MPVARSSSRKRAHFEDDLSSESSPSAGPSTPPRQPRSGILRREKLNRDDVPGSTGDTHQPSPSQGQRRGEHLRKESSTPNLGVPAGAPISERPPLLQYCDFHPPQPISSIYPGQACPVPSTFALPATQPQQYIDPATAFTNLKMAYENAFPPNLGVHFQPPVSDTTSGPFMHHYVPRHDGVFVQPCVPQTGVAIPVQEPAIVSPVTAVFTPIMMQPLQQSIMMQGVAPMTHGSYISQPDTMQSPPQVVAGNLPRMTMPVHADPVLGIGRTGYELAGDQMQFAEANGLLQPQDFKPADDNPSRYYMVRELDGAWTQRNRRTIESLGCRWYLADEGYFYAVRLPD